MKHFGDGGRVRFRGGCEHFPNCNRYPSEWDLAIEEGFDGDFIGSIEGNAVRASFFSRFKGEAQAGEALEVRLFEIEVAQGCEIEGEIRGGALRVCQRLEDGQAHVSDGDLG